MGGLYLEQIACQADKTTSSLNLCAAKLFIAVNSLHLCNQ